MLDIAKIRDLSAGADHHLSKLENDFVPLLREFTESMRAIKRSQEEMVIWEVRQLREELGELRRQLKRYGLPEVNQYESRLEKIRETLNNDAWPMAVEETAICETEDSMKVRADAIINCVVGEHLKDLKFLDYGCGFGHTTVAAQAAETKITLGYDVDLAKCKLQGPIFTADFEEVKKNAPYDVVLIHDVLDHITLIDPIAALRQVRSVLPNKGRVYIRLHPWSARHGGHLYKQINKAFLHLVLDDVELTRIGGWTCEHNIKVIRPIPTYRHWFEQSGFEIKSEIPVKRKVEEVFLKPSHIHGRLVDLWGNAEELEQHMEIEFMEYILDAPSNQQIL